MACTTCPPPDCTCPVKDLSTDCILYTGTTVLSHIGTQPKTLGTQVLININKALGDLKDSLGTYFQLSNVGVGANVYKGNTQTGVRELRTIVQGTNVVVTENTDDITISVPNATEALAGSIEIATQAETNAGTDDTRAVTPLKLQQYLLSGSFLPVASTTVQGVIEIATQGEVNAKVDTTRAVVPSTLAAYVLNPANLPLATESAAGIAEIATTAEAQALTDNTRFLTPLKFASITATETRVGVLEVATAAEANALTSDIKIITPAKLPISSETQLGLAERATTAETTAGTDDVRYITPLKLQQKVDALPAGATNTSELTNDGDDGVNPFISAADLVVNEAQTAPYTLVPADNGKVIHVSGSGDITVPTGLGSAFECGIIQVGGGILDIVASGTTLRIPAFLANPIRGEHAQVLIRSAIPANTFNVLGNLTAL